MYQFFSSDQFGISMSTANGIANGIVALVALFILYLLYKMFTRPRMASGRRSKNARLAITDAASIDDRRRLVLVRRDNVEHLIMIGGETDMVIEADIVRGAATAAPVNETRAPRAAAPATTQPKSPPPIPRSEPSVAASSTKAAPVSSSSEAPKPASVVPSTPSPAAPVTPAKPAAAAAVATATTAPSNPAPAISPSVTAKPAPAPASGSDASSLIGDIGKKPVEPAKASSAPTPVAADKPKPSVGDNMDALLTEITAKK